MPSLLCPSLGSSEDLGGVKFKGVGDQHFSQFGEVLLRRFGIIGHKLKVLKLQRVLLGKALSSQASSSTKYIRV